MSIIAPRSEAEAIEAVRWALSAKAPLAVEGGGSKRALGRPVETADRLVMAGLYRIISHEPEELLLVAEPGASMAEISSLLAGRGQCLAFEPPDYGPLLGLPAGGGTLGGLVSTGLSGPRRFKAGAVRDHVLGVAAISGRAERFFAGGKVVKNVTGYDLPKLLTGAYGSLGVLTEITLKVMPAPQTARTLVLAGIDGEAASRALADALASPAEISAAAWTPANLALPELPSRTPCILLRLEGIAVSVAARLQGLAGLLEGRAALAELGAEETAEIWRHLRDALPLADQPDLAVWRLSVPPMQGMAVLGRIRQALPRALGWLDWGGGLIWVGVPARLADAAADIVRGALLEGDGAEGHATLVRAPDALRRTIPVFQPEPEPVAALSARIKAQFDPEAILNPGRMLAGR